MQGESETLWKALLISSILIITVAIAASSIAFVQPKYTLSIYHFNVQYNPGDPIATERILTDALYGVLKIYDKHPSWKFTIEIQGLAIEMLYKNYTETFKLLKKLVDRGQCELIVTHYSDQLWIAYPYEDLTRSIKLSHEIINKTGLKVADIAMFQEGQWAPGLVQISDLGYRATLVSEDILLWFGYKTDLPVLKWKFLGKQIYLVIFSGGIRSKNGITWMWRWVQDGEVAVTKAYENEFKYDPNMAKNHEQRMMFLESMGWKFITVSEWIKIAENNGLVGDLDKYLPATTWNNPSCLGPFRWLGDHKATYEDDGEVRALNSIARGKIIAAELIHEKYKYLLDEDEAKNMSDKLSLSWKYLFLAEVSDSTGWNPLKNEIDYSNYYSQLAISLAESVAMEYMKVLNVRYIHVNSLTGEVLPTNSSASPWEMQYLGPSDADINVTAIGTNISVVKYAYNWSGINVIKLIIEAGPSDNMTISINSNFSQIRISPVLAENVTVLLNHSDYPRDFWLALSNGLIIGKDLAVVRSNLDRFIAVKWSSNRISLVETLQEKKVRYVLYLIQNPLEIQLDKIVSFANYINVYPSVTFAMGGE